MYETESNPVQPVSLGRGVALAGYWSAGATWLLALVVLLLLLGALWAMGRYNLRAERAASRPTTTEGTTPVAGFE